MSAPLRRGRATRHPQQIVALGLAVVMVTSSCTSSCTNAPGVGQGGAAPASAVAPAAGSGAVTNQSATAQPVAAQNLSSADREQLARDLEQQFRAVEAFAAAVPSETFDSGAVLAKIGRDPSAIFRWVRDETLWVPYRGVLRGPIGVLMDRKGNDLDRALLLSQLLKLAGKEVRLAHGTLSDAQAGEVLRVPRPRPTGKPLATPEFAPEVKVLLDQYARDDPGNAAKLRSFADELLQKETRMAREAGERSAAQARTLAAAIGLPPSKGGATPSPSSLEGLRDHWWAQALQDSGWTDLDPTMPDSEPGRPLATAQATLAADALDRALYHEVEVRVITERWEQGHLEETPVLTHVLRPSELFGIDVSLFHLPIAWPKDFNSAHEPDLPKALKAIGLGQHEWLPVLQVGSAIVSQFSFTDAGLKRTARPGPVAALGTAIERGVEGISSLFGSRDDQTKHAVLTAEWIEYEIRSPGQPPRKIRRQLFDSIGPAQRTAAALPEPTMTDNRHRDVALTLLGKTDILVLGCQLSRDFVAHLLGQRFLANRPALLKLVSAEPRDEGAIQDLLAQLTPAPGPIYGLALARSRWSPSPNDVYADRPIILSAHQQLREGSDESLVATYGFDIVANDVAVRADSKLDASLVRLQQGVLDTAAESVLAAAIEPEAGDDHRTISSVSEIYRLSSGQGIEWVTIRSTEDPAWQRSELEPDIRARIGQDLAAGYVVVAPKRAVMLDGRATVGWWRVDPRNGQSLSVDEKGWGATLVEYARITLWGVALGICTGKAGHSYEKSAALSLFKLYLCIVAFSGATSGFIFASQYLSVLGQLFGVLAGTASLAS